MTTFVTVLSENAFAPQPYDEERVVIVPNRYKFLGFHEDVRPPYRGTWSKKSDVVNGRNSCRAKDTKYMDYEHDSEAEWEEGDDEEGEDLQDEKDDGEEEEIRNEQVRARSTSHFLSHALTLSFRTMMAGSRPRTT